MAKTSTAMDLRLPRPDRERTTRKELPKPKQHEHYFKGPIPLGWLEAAGRQPGKALHIAIALWYQGRVTRGAEVSVPTALLRRFGVDRWACARGLAALEQAGLVSVVRGVGRKPVITILGAPSKAPG